MKQSPLPSYEVEIVLTNLSAVLKRARLLRNETQVLAAQRVNISLSTYVRMESQQISQLAGIGIGTFFEALCIVGYKDALLTLAAPNNDIEGALLLERKIPKRGRALQRSAPVIKRVK